MSPRLTADLLEALLPERFPVSLRDGQSRDISLRTASALPARNGCLPKHNHSPQNKPLKTRAKRILEQGGCLGNFLSARKRQIHGTT